MCARQIVVLMTGAAFFRRHTVTGGAATHVHGMGMPVVALPGKISGGVAIHASRMAQDRSKGREQRAVPFCRSRRGDGACRRWFCRPSWADEQQRAAEG